MPTATKQHQTLSDARAALATPIDFETFLNKLSAKDRTNAQRHVAACDLEGDGKHGALWRRLACALMTLAPHAIKFNGQQSAQFFIPDGKYRMQVFALEDLRDGKINIYCPNVLDDAITAGLLARRTEPGDDDETSARYVIAGTDQSLDITTLDGTTPNPAAFYKDMLGWNRKAVRITLPVTATSLEVEAAEQLCAISSKKWQPKAA